MAEQMWMDVFGHFATDLTGHFPIFPHLLIAAYACGFSVVLKNNATNKDTVIDLVEFFKPMDDDILVRISDLEKKNKAAKRAEYNKLKAELKKMRDEYGFDEE